MRADATIFVATFRLVEGEPFDTSHGDDLYRSVFAADAKETSAA